ncbi:unnamed protein product [Calypogeia fissa]
MEAAVCSGGPCLWVRNGVLGPAAFTVLQCRKREVISSFGGLRECWRLEHKQTEELVRRASSRFSPQGAVEELKSSIWGDRVRNPRCLKAPASYCQHESCKVDIDASLSGGNQDQKEMNPGTVSRREWLLFSGFLAGALAVPRNAHGLWRISDLADNDLATDGSSLTTANGAMVGSNESRQQQPADVKSWYRYRGEGFVIRVPPGYEDVLDYEDEDGDGESPYGRRAKEKPFAARFASPDRDEVLSIVIKPASKLRLSFYETKDITDFGSIKEAAPNFVPPGARLVSARIINSKASRVPRTYYMYEFLAKGMHFMLLAGVSKGNVFVLGASTPQSKWKDYGNRLQLASSTFYLP